MSIQSFAPEPTMVPKGRETCRRLTGAMAVALAFFLAGSLSAQQTGTVTGAVVNGETGEPMSNVQISVTGTGLGSITNNDGRFLILNVPAGTHEVVAQLIGFAERRQTVTVTAGQSLVVNLTLYAQAVELEGVVVTGTAIAAQRREIGNSISLVSSDEIVAAGAINLEDALRGRALGVGVTGASGTAGAGSDILLRGTNSVNGSARRTSTASRSSRAPPRPACTAPTPAPA